MRRTLFTPAARAALTCAILVACVGPLIAGGFQLQSAQMAACQSNMKQSALGILMYVQDYDERYPPMKDMSVVKPRVYPYVKNNAVFRCPASNEEYQPNPALNYVNVSKLNAPAEMVMFRDAKPHALDSGNAWNVAYADGHVKSVSSEPALGKLAPPPSRREIITEELRMLRAERSRLDEAVIRKQRQQIDARIRVLEAELRRLHGKH